VLLGVGSGGVQGFIVGATTQVKPDAFASPTSDGKGWVLEAAMPWAALGITPKPGTTLRFDLAVDDGDGKRLLSRLAWSGGKDGATDRSTWGRLLLAP
jgi:hypothetical protein